MGKSPGWGWKTLTSVSASGGAVALGAWSPAPLIIAGCVLALLATTVAVVVLTAARGRNRDQQLNSAATLDSLLKALGGSAPEPPDGQAAGGCGHCARPAARSPEGRRASRPRNRGQVRARGSRRPRRQPSM